MRARVLHSGPSFWHFSSPGCSPTNRLVGHGNSIVSGRSRWEREREVIQIQMKRDRIECAGQGRIRATDRKGGASQLCVRRRNEG